MALQMATDDQTVVEILKSMKIYHRSMKQIRKQQKKQDKGFAGFLIHGDEASYQFRYYWGYPDRCDNGWIAAWVNFNDPDWPKLTAMLAVKLGLDAFGGKQVMQ